MRNLLIALALATTYAAAPSSAVASQEGEVVVSNQKFSITKVETDGKVRYQWLAANGRGGLQPTLKAAKKAAKAALKDG